MYKVLKLHIRNAALNIPSEYKYPNNVKIDTLPYSTLRGAIYALFGERPISRYNPSFEKRFKIFWIDKLMDNAYYKIYENHYLDDSFFSSGIAKKEVCFRRKSHYVLDKNINVDEYLLSQHSDFVFELKKLYKSPDLQQAFLCFRNDTVSLYKKDLKNSCEAIKNISYLRKKEKDYNQNWCLSDGYLRNFYTRYWIRSENSIGEKEHFGVRGGPSFKYIFDADVILLVPSESIQQKILSKLSCCSRVVSFAEGGLMWPSINSHFDFIHLSSTSGYKKINECDVFVL